MIFIIQEYDKKQKPAFTMLKLGCIELYRRLFLLPGCRASWKIDDAILKKEFIATRLNS